MTGIMSWGIRVTIVWYTLSKIVAGNSEVVVETTFLDLRTVVFFTFSDFLVVFPAFEIFVFIVSVFFRAICLLLGLSVPILYYFIGY
jgi:hypothetical protein